MANMRVHELAKELNISSKDITDMLSSIEKKYTGLEKMKLTMLKADSKQKQLLTITQ